MTVKMSKKKHIFHACKLHKLLKDSRKTYFDNGSIANDIFFTVYPVYIQITQNFVCKYEKYMIILHLIQHKFV